LTEYARQKLKYLFNF